MIKLPTAKQDKSKIVRNLGKKYKYVPYLERAIATFEDEWEFVYHEKEHDHHWHPSSHCVPVATHLYDIATGKIEPEVFGASTRKAFQVGHFWHQWLQHITLHKLEMCKPEAIERKGKREWGVTKCPKCKGTAKETVVLREGNPRTQLKASCPQCDAAGNYHPPYHAVAGSGDLAPLEAPGWTGLVDYKTMNVQSFTQQGLPPRFEVEYECQINVYMDLFDMAEAIILPVNKDTGEFKEFLYERNQPLVDLIYQKFEFVSMCLDAGEAPTAEDDKMFAIKPLLQGPVSV